MRGHLRPLTVFAILMGLWWAPDATAELYGWHQATADPGAWWRESALGPWPIDELLVPYPTDLEPVWIDPPLRPATRSHQPPLVRPVRRPVYVRVAERVSGMHRRVTGMVEHFAHVLRRQLRPPHTPPPDTSPKSAFRGGQAMPTQYQEIKKGLRRVLNALDSLEPLSPKEPTPSSPSARRTVTGHRASFSLEGPWTFPDVLAPPTPWSVDPASPPRKRHSANLNAVFGQSIGVAGLVTLLLTPVWGLFAAGTVYGRPRDGPWLGR